jgi:uncharacterized protein YdcH (DUF465 family)
MPQEKKYALALTNAKLKRGWHCAILSNWRSTSMEEKEIKEHLLKENQEFRKAFDQHKKLEKKLDQYQIKSFLTEEDEWKEKQLKKSKLLLKDKMYHMIREYRRSLE